MGFLHWMHHFNEFEPTCSSLRWVRVRGVLEEGEIPNLVGRPPNIYTSAMFQTFATLSNLRLHSTVA